MIIGLVYLLIFCSTINSSQLPPSGFSSLSSISKFIKEFHGSFDKYTNPDGQWTEDANETELVDIAFMKNLATNRNGSHLVKCSGSRKSPSMSVELIEQSSRLTALLAPNPNVTSKTQEADCVLLLFYSRTCPFSCLAAPHFNALARAFPAVKLAAVNAMLQPSFNTQYGIAGVPTIILFHNGRAVGKFNESEYTLKMFALFIVRFTDIMPEERIFVTSADFGGPVPSQLVKEDNYVLILCWLVVVINIVFAVSRSNVWRCLSDTVANAWREARDAQSHHEHVQ